MSEERFMKLMGALSKITQSLGAASLAANPGLDREH
jgi:hypothetical protein